MHKIARERYNASYSENKYKAFLEDLNTTYRLPVKFRVAETPVFFDRKFKEKVLQASEEILKTVMHSDFLALTELAIPKHQRVPGDEQIPTFIAVDFAICKNQLGEYEPQLIELQGFPTLFAYMSVLPELYQKYFDVAEGFSPYLQNGGQKTFQERLGKIILGNHKPENVVLLEVEPDLQNTAIDFVITEALFGIKSLCLSDVIKEEKKLYYINNGIKTPINRLYNRIIFDELEQRDDLVRQFELTDNVEVEWVSHPNWFFRISKYIMPLINSTYAPECKLLSSYQEFPLDLENYVLKPLFSFAGAGVMFHVTLDDLLQIPKEKYNDYMLQRKVKYEPLIQEPGEKEPSSKCELRIFYFWEEGMQKPEPVLNLTRLSKGEMIGVKYNKNKTWVGGSVAFFEE